MAEEILTMPNHFHGSRGECPRCTARLAEWLSKIDGVQQVEVLSNPVRIRYQRDPAQQTREDIDRAAQAAISHIEQRYQHASLDVEGMDCADCARKVERGVASMDGVEDAAVQLMSAKLDVEFDRTATSIPQIAKRVSSLGYSVVESVDQVEATSQRPLALQILSRRENLLALTAGILAITGGIFHIAGVSDTLTTTLYLAAIIIGGVPLAIKGLRSLIRGRSIDINLLMTIAVIGAVAIGELVEGAVVVVLFALSEALESYAMQRTRQSIHSLMEIAPSRALVIRDGVEMLLPVEEIGTGETVIVQPGSRVPLDGEIVAGASSIDESPLTGESLPVIKRVGDQAFAGTLNTEGVLQVRVTRVAQDSSVARILQLVERAQAQRAPVQLLVDRFASIYTPAVVVFAALLATVPTLVFGADFREWVYRALVILVVACPCALVISTPVSIVSAIASAARRGILIKGGAALERASKITAIAFDKTGTLTRGEPHVISVSPETGYSEQQVLDIAASLERHIDHPLARAIVSHSPSPATAATEVVTTTGAGVTGTIGEHTYQAGSAALFKDQEIPATTRAAISQIESRGGTTVLVGSEREIIGVIGLADTVRPEAVEATSRLHEVGVRQLVMLSGDRQVSADHIAAQIGIDDARGELLPGDKLRAIEEIRAAGHSVAMVGDGINDAPALAAADLGIAMGTAGNDTALETADIALMADDLTGISRVIELAHRARAIIGMNITLALGVKAVVFALTLAGIASLWLAILADVGAALLVIANGLRLYQGEPEHRSPALEQRPSAALGD